MGVHDQARLHADRRPVGAVHALHFAPDQAVADVVDARAAVPLEGGAQEAQLPEFQEDLLRSKVPVRCACTMREAAAPWP